MGLALFFGSGLGLGRYRPGDGQTATFLASGNPQMPCGQHAMLSEALSSSEGLFSCLGEFVGMVNRGRRLGMFGDIGYRSGGAVLAPAGW